jgi:hypothetical protein
MAKYIKRNPKLIEADQYTDYFTPPGVRIIDEQSFVCTAQGNLVPIKHGEWVVKEEGYDDRHYPVADEIFRQTYSLYYEDAVSTPSSY